MSPIVKREKKNVIWGQSLYIYNFSFATNGGKYLDLQGQQADFRDKWAHAYQQAIMKIHHGPLSLLL